MPRKKKQGNVFAALAEEDFTQVKQGQKGKPKKKKEPTDPGILELRKLRKKLKDITSLELSLSKLNADQKAKIAMRAEFEQRVSELEKKFPWCRAPSKPSFVQPKMPTIVSKQVHSITVPNAAQRLTTMAGRVLRPSERAKPAPPRNAVITCPTPKKKKKKPSSGKPDAESITGCKKLLKAVKKDLKRVAEAQRQAKLGITLSPKDQELLDSRYDKEAEEKMLKKKLVELLAQGKVTADERTSILERLKKKLIQCNELEQRIVKGEKLEADEQKLLKSKPSLLQEYSQINQMTPIDRVEEQPKKKRLCDFPKAVQARVFQVDQKIKTLRAQLATAEELEKRFNTKRGGKPLTIQELRKVNSIESLQGRIRKLEEEMENAMKCE